MPSGEREILTSLLREQVDAGLVPMNVLRDVCRHLSPLTVLGPYAKEPNICWMLSLDITPNMSSSNSCNPTTNVYKDEQVHHLSKCRGMAPLNGR